MANSTHNPLPDPHLTAYLSEDDCKTWKGGLLLDERESVSYPDGIQAPDGTIYIAYDRKRVNGEVLMATFTEDDILARKEVSGKVRLKVPVKQTEAALKEAKNGVI